MFSDTTTSYQIVHTLQVFKSIHACNLSNITITILCYIHHNDSTPIYRLMSNDLNYNDLIGVLNLNPRALKEPMDNVVGKIKTYGHVLDFEI